MKTLGLLILAAGALVSTGLTAAPRDGTGIAHFEPLERMTLRTPSRADAVLDEPLGPVSMSFDALGRTYDLELEPNSALVSPAARAVLAPNVSVMRGRISDAPQSWARIVLIDGLPSGLIWDGTRLLAIERPGDSAVGSVDPVIYRLADLQVQSGAMSCGTAPAVANASAMYSDMVGELKTALQQGPGAVEEIEIGAIGDSAFAAGRVDPEGAILTRLNNVDGIYSSELGIQITVPLVEILEEASDPFVDTTDTDRLIELLDDYRAGNQAQRDLGLTHLFTGQELDGSTVGIAYIGVLCDPGFGVGLTQGLSGVTVDSLIAAHEIGHNFGAGHDGDADGSCPDEPDDQFIMASRVNGSNNTFSDCSKSVMLATAAEAACITPLPGVDVSVTSFDEAETALLGNAINLNFDIENRGLNDAEDVAAEITLPTNVSLLAASASQGSCTDGAATVSCDLGTVSGATSANVTITASTDAPGDAAFAALVTATNDDVATNNSDLHVVTVEPAVNLVAIVPNRTVTVDQSVSASVTIDNTSILDATNVTATITVDTGLQADSVSWTAGDCTINTVQIDCTANTLAAQSTSILVLGVTGLSTGSLGYTIELGSSEQDANPADNVVSGTVTVNAERSEDSGGGSPGLLLLGILGGIALRRRVRA